MTETRERTTTGTFEKAWESIDGVNGWLTRGQAKALWDGARKAPKGAIVEIGSHHGRSTTILAKGAQLGTRVCAIDPFDDPRWGGGEGAMAIFRENLARAGVESVVEPLQGTSEHVRPSWNGDPIALLYIDGAHDLPSVLIDIDGWEPLVVDGGFVFIHDAFSSVGVTKAILKRHLASRSFRYVGSVRSLAIFRKVRMSVPGAIWNGVKVASRLPYFGRNLAVKAVRRRGWQWPQKAMLHRDAVDPY